MRPGLRDPGSFQVSVALPFVGALLIVATLRDVFHMLFHPSGQGGFSIAVFRGVWGLTGKLGGWARSLSGPLSMVLVIALWVATLIVGFSFLYWPSMPEAFTYSSALEPMARDDYIDAVYYSWVTQATLGYGTISPEEGIFRILAPLQATLGFGLLTLFVTWVLSGYPALRRQRSAARSIHALSSAHEGAEKVPPATLARQMEQLSGHINEARVDFVQYPSTFFFAAPGRTLSLAHGLPFLTRLVRTDGLAEEARPAAAQLASSLDLFAAALAEQHLSMTGAETDEVLRAYRSHQGGLDTAAG